MLDVNGDGMDVGERDDVRECVDWYDGLCVREAGSGF